MCSDNFSKTSSFNPARTSHSFGRNRALYLGAKRSFAPNRVKKLQKWI